MSENLADTAGDIWVVVSTTSISPTNAILTVDARPDDDSIQAAVRVSRPRLYPTNSPISVRSMRLLEGTHTLAPGDCGWIQLSPSQDLDLLPNGPIRLSRRSPSGSIGKWAFVVKMPSGQLEIYVPPSGALSPSDSTSQVQVFKKLVGFMFRLPGANSGSLVQSDNLTGLAA